MKNLIIMIFKFLRSFLLFLRVPNPLIERIAYIVKKISYFSKGDEIDKFLNGSFHFATSIENKEYGLMQRQYLTQNDWVGYFKAIECEFSKYPRRNFCHSKVYDYESTLYIAFFCSYFDSHFYERTIKIYNEKFPLIKWIICTIGESKMPPDAANYFRFNSIEDAKYFVERFADIVIDADGPLRPTPALSLLNTVDCLVINYYNLIASGSDRLYDAIIAPAGVDIAPLVLEKEIVRLECLGSWYFEQFALNYDISKLKWDFAIISEQFKFGIDFYSTFGILSKNHKLIFIGLKAKSKVVEKLIEYGWCLDNITFIPHMHFEELRRFLDLHVLTILDVRNYSSGSGTILGLSAGVPTVCYFGEYWINQMAASIMKKAGLEQFIYTEVSQISEIINQYKRTYQSAHVIVRDESYKTGYLVPQTFLKEFYESVIKLLNRFVSNDK